jgi:hypothetical protein
VRVVGALIPLKKGRGRSKYKSVQKIHVTIIAILLNEEPPKKEKYMTKQEKAQN